MFKRDLPKPLPEYTLPISNFAGGMNNISGDNVLKPNESTDSQNMAFISDDLMETRRGTVLVHDSLSLLPITWKDKYKPINSAILHLEASDEELYINEVKVCDVAGQVKGTNYLGNYYFVDGTDYRVYNGTKSYKIVAPPEGRLAAQANLGQKVIVLDAWDARITNGMSVQIESTAGIETGSISSYVENTKTVTLLANLTYTHPAGTLVRLYIPKTSEYTEGQWGTSETQNMKWYEPCSNELDDNYKGENFMPTNCTILVSHDNRLYLSGDPDNPHDVYISDIGNPYYFPVFLITQLNPNSDQIVDIVEFDDGVVIGRSNDIYCLSGESNILETGDAFVLRKVNTHTGFKTINNAVVGNNYLFYLGNDENVYAMNSPYYNSDQLKTSVISKTLDFRREPFNATDEHFLACPGVFHNGEYLFKLGTNLIVYSYQMQAFTYYTGIGMSSLYSDGINLYAGKTNSKVVLFSKDAFDDDGVTIVSKWHSKRFDCGSPINYKYFRDCFIQSHVFDDCGSTVKLVFEIDHLDIPGTVTIVNVLSYFGTAKFGDAFNNRNIVQNDPVRIEERGRLIRFKLFNDVAGERMRVYSLNTLYTMRDTR